MIRMLTYRPVFWVLVMALLSAVSTRGAWADADSAERHTVSGLNSGFTAEYADFDAYVSAMRDMILRARVFGPGQDRQAIMEAVAPRGLRPSVGCDSGGPDSVRRGILLTHGLTDSPYLMRHLARFFQDECFYVQLLLLPGHGSRPGDLLDVRWQEWAEAYAFGVRTLTTRVDEVYLGGFSTGGTLAIHYAMDHPDVRGLLLFSPALAVTPLARASCWLDTASGLFSRLAWLGPKQPNDDPYKYESFAANAACQIFRLTQEIAPVLDERPLSLPVFVAASADDATIDAGATQAFFTHVRHPRKHMILYAREATGERDGTQVVDSRVPAQGVVSSAHTAMVMPRSDPHYGADGDYAFCTRYYQSDDVAYKRCKAKDEDLLGETTSEFLDQGVVRRLTYNPHFDGMLEAMRAFLAAR